MRFISILVLVTSFLVNLNAGVFSEDFLSITDTDKRKAEFVKVVLPLINQANKKIIQERNQVIIYFKNIEKQNNSAEEIAAIKKIAKKYNIDNIEDEEIFKLRVAPVPPSLALTQAAIESGWGTSRFVREANNIFGQWTWTQENGIVPKDREDGKTHKIRVFSSLQESTDSYILNLNRNKAYKEFRKARMKSDNFDGIAASDKMINYSELREEYINILKKIIKSNGFLKYDNQENYKIS